MHSTERVAPPSAEARARLAAHAERLRALHRGPQPLLLPNAWDVASARVVAEAGFPAVATTSSGVAASLGYPDGEQAPAEEMLAAVARIARVVDLPLTADIEAGYGLGAEELVARLLAAGAVGCNLEDSDHAAGTLVEPARQAERLAAVRRAAQALGVGVVLNARVDVFLRQLGDPSTRAAEAVRRGRLYLEAGADCVFPILIAEESDIAAVVAGVPGPVNVLAMPTGPSLERLRALGVARVSFGGRLHRAAMADHQRRVLAIRAGEGF